VVRIRRRRRIGGAGDQGDRLSLMVSRLAKRPTDSGTRMTLREPIVGAGHDMAEGRDLHQGAGMHRHPTFNTLTVRHF